MSREGTHIQVEGALMPLVGLRLAIARRAADMANFQFGEMTIVDRGSVGEFALHVQCPWRIDGPDGVITGRLDLFEPADPSVDAGDSWGYEKDGNLLDRRLHDLLGGWDSQTKSFVNNTNFLKVESVHSEGFGGATISLSGGYRLLLFPAGSRGEDWRLFQPRKDDPHFVVSGGIVEEADSERAT